MELYTGKKCTKPCREVLIEQQVSTLLPTPLPQAKIQNLGSSNPVADITVADNTVEAVTEFRYLGSIQSSSGRCYPDLH